MMEKQIPKIIHYCWFGGKPLPPLAEKCISSWKKYLPDYEIKQWDETNFDVNGIKYTAQAYEAKKYAFVSDYARFIILYQYGGLYFDTDVEIIKPLDDIISNGPFMGCEIKYVTDGSAKNLGVNPGLGIGSYSGHLIYKGIIDLYQNLSFINEDGSLSRKTVVEHTTEFLCKKGLVNTPNIQSIGDLKIYPKEYFCPIDYKTNQIEITNETRTIHHYSGSWHSSKQKFTRTIELLFGRKPVDLLVQIKKMLKKA